MDISNAIVEAIYSMKPPGRFLKKCPNTGQWSELSTRDAADRVAQAMAYAVRGKDKSKRRREERRRSLRSSRQKSKNEGDDDVVRKSSQIAHPSTHLQQRAIADQLRDNASSSSSAHHGLDTRRGGAVGTSNDMPCASDLLRVLGNSNLQQQLLLQRLQQPSTTTTTLPTSSVNSIDQNIDQHGLAQLLAQTIQQQQQQLPPQYTIGQNPIGQLLQSQTPLQPATLEGLTHQLLNQAQQQQHQQQQQLLLQRLSNQQNVIPSASLPPTLSLTAPFLTGTRSQPEPANNHILQNLQQQSNTPSSNALLLSSVLSSLQQQPNSTVGISNAPQGAQQADQLQRSLMLQQNQLLATSVSLGASSNNQLAFQQQQLQPLDSLLQQTLQATLQLQQNLQGLPPPAPINNSTGIASANVVAAAQTSRREEGEDEVYSEPEDDDYCGD
eukprot:scaffold33660_cov87-Skeletonema_dohrnii-CCMP3373.AAC.1